MSWAVFSTSDTIWEFVIHGAARHSHAIPPATTGAAMLVPSHQR